MDQKRLTSSSFMRYFSKTLIINWSCRPLLDLQISLWMNW